MKRWGRAMMKGWMRRLAPTYPALVGLSMGVLMLVAGLKDSHDPERVVAMLLFGLFALLGFLLFGRQRLDNLAGDDAASDTSKA